MLTDIDGQTDDESHSDVNSNVDGDQCRQIESTGIVLDSTVDNETLANHSVRKFNRPLFAMIGSYRCEPNEIHFDCDGIALTGIKPNEANARIEYNITIPYEDMNALCYFDDATHPSIFIEPSIKSNTKINCALLLAINSRNERNFDVNSLDIRERLIAVMLRNSLGNWFSQYLKLVAKRQNPNMKWLDIDLMKEKLISNVEQNKHTIQMPRLVKISRNVDRICEAMTGEPRTKDWTQANETERENENIMKFDEQRTKLIDTSRDNEEAHRCDHCRRRSHEITTSNRAPAIPHDLFYGQRQRRSSLPTVFSTNVRPRVGLSQSVEAVIQIDDDDDSTDIKNECDYDLNRVILIFPENEENAIQLSGNDILCLNKGEFLNDNIIYFYLRRLSSCFGSISNDVMEKTHIFDTLFFMQLTERRPTKRKHNEEPYSFEIRYHKKLKNWTKNVDIFSKDFLIMPIIKESHWFLAIVCYANNVSEYSTQSKEPDKRPCILFMDSLGNAGLKKRMSTPIREFLSYEWKEKKDTDVQFKSRLLMRDHFPRVPSQTNSSDCGLFVLEYVEQFLKDPNYVLNKINGNLKLTNFDKWFSINEAQDKRQTIRSIIFSLIKPEIANKLKKFVKDEIYSDEEDVKDENGTVFDESMDFDIVSKRKVDLECSDESVTRSMNESVKSVQTKNFIDKLEEYLLTTSEASPVISQDNSDSVKIEANVKRSKSQIRKKK